MQIVNQLMGLTASANESIRPLSQSLDLTIRAGPLIFGGSKLFLLTIQLSYDRWPPFKYISSIIFNSSFIF